MIVYLEDLLTNIKQSRGKGNSKQQTTNLDLVWVMSLCDNSESPLGQVWELPNIDDLTVGLLENNPHEYLRVLENLSVRGDRSKVNDKLNEKSYVTWYSNHLFSLSRLVGTLNQEAQNRADYPIDSFYGSRICRGISTDLAINLLKMMLNAGGDITGKDYYGINVLDFLKKGSEESIFYRTGNEEYTRFVETVYTRASSVTGVCEEGIPPEH